MIDSKMCIDLLLSPSLANLEEEGFGEAAWTMGLILLAG